MNFITFVRLLTLLPLIVLAGCASVNINNDTQMETIGEDAVIVMGATPKVGLNFNRGENKPDGWHADRLQIFPFRINSDAGYIVAKLPAKSNKNSYGVTHIRIGGGLNMGYAPCEFEHTITFDAPAGRVVFVGDFLFDSPETTTAENQGIDDAREYLKVNYPELAPHLTPGNSVLQPIANVRCPRWYDYLPLYF